MSLMTEECEQLLFEELDRLIWDFVLLNETWRSADEEIWTTSGHLFLGSGEVHIDIVAWPGAKYETNFFNKMCVFIK